MSDWRRPRNMKHVSGLETGEHCTGGHEIICHVEVYYTKMRYTRICWWVFDFLFAHGFLFFCGEKFSGWSALDCESPILPVLDLKNYTLTSVDVMSSL